MSNEISDEELIEKANLRPMFKLEATIGLAALRMVREMAKKLGVSMEQITREHILKEAARDNEDSLRFKEYLDAIGGKPKER